jgi:hypothetical protein
MSKLPIKKNIDEKLDLISNKNRIVTDDIPRNATDDIPKISPRSASTIYLDNVSKNGEKFNSISKLQPKTEVRSRLTGPPIEKTLKPTTKSQSGSNVNNFSDSDSKIVGSVKDMINSRNSAQNINTHSSDNMKFNDIKAMKSLSIDPSNVKNDSSKFSSKIKDRMIARRNSLEKEIIPPPPTSLRTPSSPSSSSASPNKTFGTMAESVRNLAKQNTNTDNKSRDNALYLAKNLRPKSINIISPRTSVRIDTNIPARSVLNRLPTPRTLKKSNEGQTSIQNTTKNEEISGNRYSRDISIDSRDGKGYGRKIKIQPKLNKELFLLNKDGNIVSLKKRVLEMDIIPENVESLITKFRDLAPEDYDKLVYICMFLCMFICL